MSEHLIHPAELDRLLRTSDPEDRPVVLDVRWALGRGTAANRAEYAEGHVPGAAFVDLETTLAGPPGAGGRHPMPDIAVAQEGFRRAGVMDEQPVVVYDGSTSVAASRAWWLLQYYGKPDVRVLDGGYAAWLAAGLPVETGEVEVPEGDIVLTPGGRRLLTADDIEHYLDRHQVLDARPADRFRGENETIDPVAGHIPGAVSLPALSLVPDGVFVDSEGLVQRLTAAGGVTDRATAVYCGSGVQAAHLALALEAHGVGPRPAVYVGSWSDWISDPSRPVSTD